MQLPKAVHELEFNHGSIYGAEEEAAVLEVLRASTAGLHLAMITAKVGSDDEVISTKISEICGRPLPTCEQTMQRCIHAITQSRT